MTTKEYSAYVKGLMDGTELDKTTPEGKVIAALADLCAKMADEIETLRDELDVANEYLEELDADLGEVEELIYDECDCDEDDDDCDCGCHCHDDDDDDDEDDDDEEEFYVAECPNCGGKVYFDDSVNPEDVVCPACQKPLIEADEDELEF